MKNYFATHNTHHTPRFFILFFLRLENVVIPNYNKCSKLTFTQKIEEPLSTRVSACLEDSYYYYYRDWVLFSSPNGGRTQAQMVQHNEFVESGL